MQETDKTETSQKISLVPTISFIYTYVTKALVGRPLDGRPLAPEFSARSEIRKGKKSGPFGNSYNSGQK